MFSLHGFWCMLDVFPPPCPLIQGNPAVITVQHDEIRLISRNSIFRFVFQPVLHHQLVHSQIPNPKKTSLQLQVAFFPNKEQPREHCVWNVQQFFGLSNQKNIHVFFSGQKNIHHVAATSWCTLPKCLARALSLPGGKIFFPASWKPGSHRGFTMLRRNAAQDFPSMELGTSKFTENQVVVFVVKKVAKLQVAEKTVESNWNVCCQPFWVLLGDSSKC